MDVKSQSKKPFIPAYESSGRTFDQNCSKIETYLKPMSGFDRHISRGGSLIVSTYCVFANNAYSFSISARSLAIDSLISDNLLSVSSFMPFNFCDVLYMFAFTGEKSFRIKNSFISDTSFSNDSPERT